MAHYICSICGYDGAAKKTKRGNAKMEWFLWLALLIPGPFYTVYRRVALPRRCPHCGVDKMVKLNSDAGEILQRKFDAELGLLNVSSSVRRASTLPEPVRLHMPEDEAARPQGPKRPIDPDEW